MYGEAKAEALRAVDIYKKFGAEEDVERCIQFLQQIEDRV